MLVLGFLWLLSALCIARVVSITTYYDIRFDTMKCYGLPDEFFLNPPDVYMEIECDGIVKTTATVSNKNPVFSETISFNRVAISSYKNCKIGARESGHLTWVYHIEPGTERVYNKVATWYWKFSASATKYCDGWIKTKETYISGGWSSWSSPDECSASCAGGTNRRTRTCTNPPPQGGGAQCLFSNEQIRDCNTQPCPIDYESHDDAYNACCPSGDPACTFTSSFNNGKCSYSCGLVQGSCSYDPPVDGGWTSFNATGICSATCGGGTQEMFRTCTAPHPAHGGKQCEGDSIRFDPCNTDACPPPIDGGWTLYDVGECNVPCGGGERIISRTCTNPVPENGGANCTGEAVKTNDCNLHPCPAPVNGSWTNFTAAVECATNGTCLMERTCTDPEPAYGGADCEGEAVEFDVPCDLEECQPTAVNGGWSEYEAASECPVTCGGGLRLFIRECNNPAPQHGGLGCPGSSAKEESCNEQACPISPTNGGWTAFVTGNCSVVCGGGVRTRTRRCTQPQPANGGADCVGEAVLEEACNPAQCLTPVTSPSVAREMCCGRTDPCDAFTTYNLDDKCVYTCGQAEGYCGEATEQGDESEPEPSDEDSGSDPSNGDGDLVLSDNDNAATGQPTVRAATAVCVGVGMCMLLGICGI